MEKLLSGTAVNTGGLLVVTIINIILVPLLLNHLGLERFGLVVTASVFSIVGMISMLDLGIPGALTRSIANLTSIGRYHERLQLIVSCFWVFLVIGFVSSILFLWLSDLIADHVLNIPSAFRDKYLFAFRVLIFTYTFQFPLLILRSVYHGLGLFKHVQLAAIAVEVIRLISIIVLIEFGMDFDLVIIANALSPVVAFIGLFFILPRHISFLTTQGLDFLAVKELRKLSALIFVGRVSGTIYNGSDKILVAAFLGPMAVGALELFTKIPLLINRLLGLSVSAIVPTVAALDASLSSEIVKKIYIDGFKTYYLVLVLPLCSLFYFSDDVLLFWLGSVDASIVNNMRLMLVWSCILPIAFGGNILVGLNKGVGKLTKFKLMQTVFKVVALLFAIKAIGIYAVPVSYLVSCLPLVYLLYVFKVTLDVDIYSQILFVLRTMLCAAMPILLVEYLDLSSGTPNFLRVVLLGFLIYMCQAALCYYFVLERSERATIIKMAKSIIQKLHDWRKEL